MKTPLLNLSRVMPFAKSQHLTPLDQLYALSWPASRLPEAVQGLAVKSGLIKEKEALLVEWGSQQSFDGLFEVDQMAQQWGIEAEPVSILYNDLNPMLQRSGPAIFRLFADDQKEEKAHFVLMIKGGRWWVEILSSEMAVHRIRRTTMHQALCNVLEAPLQPAIVRLSAEAKLLPAQQKKVSDRLLREQLKDAAINGCWLLRLSPSDSFLKQSHRIGFTYDVARFVFAQASQELLRLATVGLLAQAAVSDQIAWGVLIAALLIWGTRSPLTLLRAWSEKLLITKIGVLLKQRLFYGGLQLDLELVEKTGTGQFLAWVLESETIEDAGVKGGILVLQMAITLISMTVVLMFLAGFWLGLSLMMWLLFSFWLAWRIIHRYRELNQAYSDMTNDLLEWLQGHQTRLVQEKDWHSEADGAMARYISIFRKYAGQLSWYVTIIPAGWQLLIMGGLAIKLVSGDGTHSVFALGVYFMALSLGFQYIQTMAQLSPELVRAIAAWRLIAPIQQAASIPPEAIRPVPMAVVTEELFDPFFSINVIQTSEVSETSEVFQVEVDLDEEINQPLVLQAKNLLFRYHERGRAILDHLNLVIHKGDQLLLEGPSGGGKSTLATVLTGLNSAQSGLLLLHGLDRQTIGGRRWRKKLVYAPQFHQNHVLSASLAFNLLMGRRWPASEKDLAEAEELCRELGLGDLIDRMPQGLQERVGETGWQLSHGERSRLYIARALLQQADFVILDESFASLDPESIEIALQCVLKRVPTLMVIAHP